MTTYNSSFKQKLTTAVGMLFLSIVVALALLMLRTPFSMQAVGGFALAMVATSVYRNLSNAQQLIRERNWSVCSFFLILVSVYSPIHHWEIKAIACVVLYLLHMRGLMVSCQAEKPQFGIFLASLSLSGLIMLQPTLVFMVPMCIMVMITSLRVMGFRTLLALLFGLLLPFEVWCVWAYLSSDIVRELHNLFGGMVAFDLPAIAGDGSMWGFISRNILSYNRFFIILLVFYSLVAIIYYSRFSYNDKNRTRMLYFTIIQEWPLLLLLLIFNVGSTPLLALLLIVNIAPVLAQYFIFSRGWFANALFWLFVILCIYLVLQPS